MIPDTCILLCLVLYSLCPFINATSNLTLQHRRADPEAVVQELQRRVNASLYRRKMLDNQQEKSQLSCITGNPIDDCWRCDPNWAANRQRLADCAIGFGRNALGGKGGPIYVVTDSSDPDPNNPKPGTLRHAVTRQGPIWIIFSADMLIKLENPLMVSSFKTIDGRGANVQITGGGCVSIENVSNVIVHNINIHHCVPANSDGDGLHVQGSTNIWVDHCTLSDCADGLIDCTLGSTAITISNNYFFHHDKVMLLGHSDNYVADKGMQVTVAFNRFGDGLSQRMPRCRFGYFHVANNDYVGWVVYAIGGSANPTINSQGNRYTAPSNPNKKEVTMRMDAGGEEWEAWNWRTEGDIMENGAFFVPSGDGLSPQYAMASSLAPKSADFIDQLTLNAGAMLANGGTGVSMSSPSSESGGASSGGDGAISGGSDGSYGGDGSSGDPASGGYYGMIFGSGASPPAPYQNYIILLALIVLIITNDYAVLWPPL
ncbi:hypothetical protein Nepgr_001282 [Nepenthes gracilis]|uniref:Pectate lyase n=1 Tax=Nepenthes gracilis TaxID=150966 RepID=A0AAD3P4W9_NEPGR|nr:hypothetical protein Nepgr_001282 [Nepenthes gracilis]